MPRLPRFCYDYGLMIGRGFTAMTERSPLLDREEYVEQAYFFGALRERMQQDQSTQELLTALKQEILATTKLYLAVDFLASELRLTGGFATAMAHLGHYFTPFQTFVVAEAERETGRFDFRVALEILEKEAGYRSKGASPPGMFIYQFETLCRNRLGYDRGLEAMAGDPIYDATWDEWIRTVRRQIGMVDFADMIYVRSEHYQPGENDPPLPALFGRKEGQIALANRRRDPLYLFAALQRQLGYPSVPRPQRVETERYAIPALERKIDRLESRLRLHEEELRGGINLARFYANGKDRPDTP
jgi:hypothetical protein